MTDTILITLSALVILSIALVAPRSCDVEYAVEHPNADTYISASDKLIIDWSESHE